MNNKVIRIQSIFILLTLEILLTVKLQYDFQILVSSRHFETIKIREEKQR